MGPEAGTAGRTFAAVAFTPGAAAPFRPRLVAALCRRIAALRASGVDVILLGSREAFPAGLRRDGRLARAGPEGMRGLLAALARRGVGPGLLLVVGSDFGGGGDVMLLVPEADRATVISVGAEPAGVPRAVAHAGGGSRQLAALLDEQLRRHARRRVPSIDEDPAWTVCEAGPAPLRRRVAESLFTLGAGGVATRGAVEEAVPGAQPLVLAAGVYEGSGSAQHLLAGPVWTGLTVDPPPAGDRRVLDLRTGVLERTESPAGGPPLRTLRLASITRPGVVALRAEAAASRLPAQERPLRRPAGTEMAAGHRDGVHWARTGAENGAGIVSAALQRTRHDGTVRTVQRMAAYAGGGRHQPDLPAAAAALRAADRLGFWRLLADQRAAWARPWATPRRS